MANLCDEVIALRNVILGLIVSAVVSERCLLVRNRNFRGKKFVTEPFDLYNNNAVQGHIKTQNTK